MLVNRIVLVNKIHILKYITNLNRCWTCQRHMLSFNLLFGNTACEAICRRLGQDITLKTKDFKICPQGTSKLWTWSEGIYLWTILPESHYIFYILILKCPVTLGFCVFLVMLNFFNLVNFTSHGSLNWLFEDYENIWLYFLTGCVWKKDNLFYNVFWAGFVWSIENWYYSVF